MTLTVVGHLRVAYPLLWMLPLSPLPFYVIDARCTPLLWMSFLFAGYCILWALAPPNALREAEADRLWCERHGLRPSPRF
jgi:hypothetical protein